VKSWGDSTGINAVEKSKMFSWVFWLGAKGAEVTAVHLTPPAIPVFKRFDLARIQTRERAGPRSVAGTQETQNG